MSVGVITCTNCGEPLPGEAAVKTEFIDCPQCKRPLMVNIFPALFRKPDIIRTGEKIFTDNEAGCFYHPNKKAEVPCEMCGRFLCSLCAIDLDNKHVCSSCIEAGKKKRKIKNLEHRRTLYDNIALSLAIIPLLFVFPTIFTAPASIIISVRHWKSPASILHRTKVRFIFAIILSSVQIIIWGAVFFRLLM